jgi:hypothetical protein
MSFDLTRLRRYQPEPELTQQEIKDLKDGVPNYPGGWVEVQGPDPLHEHMCGECTGSGVMLGYYPCKPCGGTGYIVPEKTVQLPSDFVDWSNVGMVVDGRVVPIVPEPEIPLYQMQSQLYAHLVHGEPAPDWVKSYAYYQKSIDDSWRKIHWYIDQEYKKRANATYPNSRELALLNSRIATLKAQLSKELQKKKSERSQRDINQLQQSINTLTKWKLPNKNSTQTGC